MPRPSPRRLEASGSTRRSNASSLTPLCLHGLRRWRVRVHLLADLVSALIELQRLRAGLRQSLWIELHDLDQLQRLFRFFSLASPADSNIADAASVVLQVLGVRLLQAGLGDHQNVLVAALANAGLLAHLVHHGAIRPVDLRPPPLGVTGDRKSTRLNSSHPSSTRMPS